MDMRQRSASAASHPHTGRMQEDQKVSACATLGNAQKAAPAQLSSIATPKETPLPDLSNPYAASSAHVASEIRVLPQCEDFVESTSRNLLAVVCRSLENAKVERLHWILKHGSIARVCKGERCTQTLRDTKTMQDCPRLHSTSSTCARTKLQAVFSFDLNVTSNIPSTPLQSLGFFSLRGVDKQSYALLGHLLSRSGRKKSWILNELSSSKAVQAL